MVRKTTNPHFQLYEPTPWQSVHDELVAQSIEIHGVDMYYLPRRRSEAFDEIYYEDAQSSFDTAYQIPIYIKSSENYLGGDAIMSQFGIEVRLQLILTVAKIHFNNNIVENEEDIYRPREGDLIHIPVFDHNTYEIKYVDDHPNFHQHGHQPMYDLTVEVWEYGNEDLDTGIPEIDCLADKTSINAYDWSILTEDGLTLLAENGDIITREEFREGQEDLGIIDSNDEIETESDVIIDFSESNPYGENEWGAN